MLPLVSLVDSTQKFEEKGDELGWSHFSTSEANTMSFIVSGVGTVTTAQC
jgi:hypothetical protein